MRWRTDFYLWLRQQAQTFGGNAGFGERRDADGFVFVRIGAGSWKVFATDIQEALEGYSGSDALARQAAAVEAFGTPCFYSPDGTVRERL